MTNGSAKTGGSAGTRPSPAFRKQVRRRQAGHLRHRLLLAALLSFLAAGAAGYLGARRPGVAPYQAELRRLAERENVNPSLLEALIETASGGRPETVAPGGGLGLTGLHPAAARLGLAAGAGDATSAAPSRAELLDPQRNLELAARALAALGPRYEYDPWLALAAFRAGPTAIDDLAERGAAADGEALVRAGTAPATRAFVLAVMADWRWREELVRRK